MSKLSWDNFKKRKRINQKDWLAKKGITSYEEFCDELKKLGVKVPSESIEDILFPKIIKKAEETKEQKRKNKKSKKTKSALDKGFSSIDEE